ncbi:MAG TPA: GNAT family N-acetyltransferase [Candidatus Pullilachnospira intestinigallinarum]|nr:GNAT family N-acetyltransferase [Candidatus Pullilachnospira intestinigallinarum]
MLTHQGTKVLHTPRLTLRRFTMEDALPMFETWANDPRVTRFLTWEPHGTPQVTRQLLAQWCADYEKPDNYNWAMELDGRLIGSIGVVRMDEKSERVDLGYCMAYDCWNQGLMPEAARAVIDYLFGQVGIHRLTICHAVKNPASGRVAQKCGLTYEGTMREFEKSAEGEFLDIAWYGIVRSEWEKQR